MKLRKLVKAVLVGVVFFIGVVIWLNFWVIPEARGKIQENDTYVMAIRTHIIAMDLPIRVIDNIHTQVLDDPGKIENEKLIDAFDRNIVLIENASSLLVRCSDNLKSNISEMNSFLHLRQHHMIRQMKALIGEIDKESSEVSALIESGSMRDIEVEKLGALREKLNEDAKTLDTLESVLMNGLINDVALVINFFFIILILILGGFGLGVYKYVTYDQQFILKSFRQMEQKQYDFLKLPKTIPLFIEEKEIYNNIKEIFKEEAFAHHVKELILNAYHMDDLIQRMFRALVSEIDIDRIGVAFVDYSNKKVVAEFGVANYGDLKIGPGFEVPFDETSLADIIIDKETVVMKDLSDIFKSKPNSPSLKLILEEGVKSNMILPLVMGDVVFGFVFFSSKKLDFFKHFHRRIAEKMIYEIDGMLNRAYFTKVILSKITSSFAELVDRKDNETGDHIERMVAYSSAIAQMVHQNPKPGYEVDSKYVMEIERNASSHDIGKVGIPDEIIKKPGKLDAHEWKIMKTHTTIGGDIFRNLREGLQVFDSDFYKFAEDIARYHHEKWDGSGYPEGLSGKDIPLSARIVALGDVFDALTSERYYKVAFGFDESVEIIKNSSGSHFDPYLVSLFLKHIDIIKSIYDGA